MRSDGKLYFSEKASGNVWKDYMEGVMNEENDFVHSVKGDAVEDKVVCVGREVVVVVQALNKVQTGKARRPSEVSLELIDAMWGRKSSDG